ncbi:hypothetical protein, partial [Flavobacterium croceum]
MIRNKPYLLLIVGFALLTIFCFLANSEPTIVCNIYDSYYVLNVKYSMLFYAYLFGSASLLYLFLDSFKINLSRMVIWFHVLGTIIMMLFFFCIGYLSNELPAQEKGIDYLLDTPNYSIYYLIITLI